MVNYVFYYESVLELLFVAVALQSPKWDQQSLSDRTTIEHITLCSL